MATALFGPQTMLGSTMPLAGVQISVIRLWLSLAGGPGQSPRKEVKAVFTKNARTNTHTHWSPASIQQPFSSPPSSVLFGFMGLSQGPGVCWICLPLARLGVWGGRGNYNGGENKQRVKQNGTWPWSHGSYLFIISPMGTFVFFCLRMFRWGEADNKYYIMWTSKSADSLASHFIPSCS